MRSKFVVAAFAGLFMAGAALAQPAPAPAPGDASVQDPQNILNLDLSTGGRVKILLRPDKAPYSVDRIKTLVRRHFYDGLTFHRVIDGFMAQGGDPKGTGEGGSDLPDLKAEFNDMPHVRGVMSMARAQDPNSANSQFFIMLQPNLTLDGNYTPIGRVFSGMEYVDAIEKGEPPANPSKIVHASIESDDQGQPPTAFVPPAAPEAAAPAAQSKQDRKAREKAAKEEKEAAEKAAKEAKKLRKQQSQPGDLANPADAVGGGGEAAVSPAPAPQGTDAAVEAVADAQPTEDAVRTVAGEEAAASPQ
ncbi:peptidylprolyl isomerase [Sphingomonas histidinilytica]|jgi:cyclophilin family peptidyl-prolyl cis-trans isomerase|uniref:peptidylprolyl isomerase n=1 Tax=Rhizorhabdus histidinilytica TaxID=439228 RepID=A0A1T4ZXD8_9SPHN|nr:peptidylprolyl isomerase [Rhizorhabdus histidinilytica]QEH78549.1 peptidylprolyl isomerase [Sphingomonas sp. C8-2]SKB27197.1 Peptidyl-prolyl cis-trans isomerase (rotamase)-cyclophilin family [Rhizorhabdus histidinilytica]